VTILITSTLKRTKPPAARIRHSLRKLLSLAGLRTAEVSVLVVGDRAMRTLNRRYRGKDRTTDVLSFPMRSGGNARLQAHLLGDIVISLPVAARQARADGEPLSTAIDRLLVHGFLHLLGYDHEQGPEETRRMEARERRLREKLGP
jgi:probable rRNA maturation factor